MAQACSAFCVRELVLRWEVKNQLCASVVKVVGSGGLCVMN